MAEFFFPPEWANAPPPKVPEVDPHRIEGLANRFIAASHGALHTAPDAIYGKAGADAVDAAPAAAAQLSGLRDATLELARDEHERRALANRLEPYHGLALDDIDRHVAEQRDVLTRQTIAERQALILRTAGLKHNEGALGGLAEAHATAARSLAQLDGTAEEPAMQAARSAIWRSAIDQRLAAGEGRRAFVLFERAKGHLVPADQRALEVPLQAGRTDAAADAWIAREQATPGEPLASRLQADERLSSAEKAAALAKIEAQQSAQESARIATVKGLDDSLEDSSRTLATTPAAYKPGTLAAIANAYDDAGEAGKANTTRQQALQEGFLQPFALSGTAAQQRLIESLPDGEERAAVEEIQRLQAEAFAKDPFTAGIALYPVGPPVPLDDLAGRIAQARTIAAYRGVPVAPFTADEIAEMRRHLAESSPQARAAVISRVNALPEDMKAAIVPVHAMSDALDESLHEGDQLAQAAPAAITPVRYEPEPDDAHSRLLVPGDGQGKLPPHNDPSSEDWAGHFASLPDGTLIEDPFPDRRNYTGYVMAPVDNLKEVAETGRRDGEEYRALRDNPHSAEDAGAFKAWKLLRNVATGGRFDTQREGNQLVSRIRNDFILHRQFLPIANINVGVYCQQFGLSLEETLTLAGRWASIASSNAAPDEPYGLKERTAYFIRKGYEIGQKGLFDSK